MKNFYQKIAGVISYPPKMFDFIMGEISKYQSDNNKEEKNIKIPIDLEGIKYGGEELFQKYIESRIKQRQETRDFLVNRASKYEPQKQEEFLHKFREEGFLKGDEEIRQEEEGPQGRSQFIWLKLNRYGTGAAASWQHYLNTLNMIVGNLTMGQIEDAIRHELRHFIQTVLGVASGKPDIASTSKVGLPSKRIQTPYFKQRPNDLQSHVLDDVEFYTSLGDAIALAKRTLIRNNIFDEEQKKEFLRNFVQNNAFFNILLNSPEARGKLNKAIVEIYKAIME